MLRQNELLVVDVVKGEITQHIALDNPRGVAFDSHGRLLALSGQKLVRFATLADQPQTVIDVGPGRSPARGARSQRQSVYHRSRQFASGEKVLGRLPAARSHRQAGQAVDRSVRSVAHEQSQRPGGRHAIACLGHRKRQFAAPRFALVGRRQTGPGVLWPHGIWRRRRARSARSRRGSITRDSNSSSIGTRGPTSWCNVFYRANKKQPYPKAALLARHAALSARSNPSDNTSPVATRTASPAACVTFIWMMEDGLARLVAALGDAQQLARAARRGVSAAVAGGDQARCPISQARRVRHVRLDRCQWRRIAAAGRSQIHSPDLQGRDRDERPGGARVAVWRYQCPLRPAVRCGRTAALRSGKARKSWPHDRPPAVGWRRSNAHRAGRLDGQHDRSVALFALWPGGQIQRRAVLELSQPLARSASQPRSRRSRPAGHGHRPHASVGRLGARQGRPDVLRQQQHGLHVSLHRRRTVCQHVVSRQPDRPVLGCAGRRRATWI